MWQKVHNTSAITILGGLNYSVAVDNVGGGVRSGRGEGAPGGGVVTQATGHHRSYWFVVSLVLQHPSLSCTPTLQWFRPPSTRVPPAHTWAHTSRMWVYVCVCGLLCVSFMCALGSEYYVPTHFRQSFPFTVLRTFTLCFSLYMKYLFFNILSVCYKSEINKLHFICNLGK